MSKRGRRIRRVANWAGAALTLLLACVWVAGEYYEFSWADQKGDYGVRIERAAMILLIELSPQKWTNVGSRPGWYVRPLRYWGDPHEWLPQIWTEIPVDFPPEYLGTRIYLLPLWLPFLFVALPTALLFYLDRRRIPPNHCRTCGYDLTGNVSGVCPECGQGIA